MSEPPGALPRVGKNRLIRKLEADVLTEAIPAPQGQGGEGSRSFTEIETKHSKRIKLSARDLLTALSGRRISITKIAFPSNSSKDGGTYADVAVATLVRAGGSGEAQMTVAVKKLRFILSDGMCEEKILRVFVNELRLLDKLSHPNIVEIIGFVEDINNRIAWLVFPWEDNGNLREFLRSGKWELPERVSLIQDVARGLEYLHTREPPICHGDLKSLNILVNSEHCALITDFGSARVSREVNDLEANPAPPPAASTSRVPPKGNERLQFKLTASDTTLTLTGPQCSFRWAPPDVLKGGQLNLASDIWALGWVAWETITDNHPFEELEVECDIMMRIIDGQLPSLHDHGQLSQIHSLCNMMLSCWRSKPKERPSVTECWRILKWIPSAVPASKDGEQSTIRSAMLLLQLGEIHRLQNRNEEATKIYEQGLAIAQSTRDQTAVARLSVKLAESLQVRGMHVEAEVAYTQAITISRSIGDDLIQASALVGLGDVQRAQSDFVDAQVSYIQAMAVHVRIGNKHGMARALVALGDVQQARSNYVHAEALYTHAMAIDVSIGSELDQANTLLILGNVQRARSNYVDAEASHTQAIAIFASIGNDLGRADALVGLGDAQRARSNYVDAEVSYTQAMAIYTGFGDEHSRAIALVGLGDVQGDRSNYVDAEASYTQAKAIFASIGNDIGQADALVGLGHVQQVRSNHVDAEASYTQAMAIYASFGKGRGRANALVGLGDVQLARSNYADAEVPYTQAMAIYARIGDGLGRAKSSLKLGLIRLLQARYSEAKILINDAAGISERIHYDLGNRVSNKLLEIVLEAERSSH